MNKRNLLDFEAEKADSDTEFGKKLNIQFVSGVQILVCSSKISGKACKHIHD